MAILEFKNKDSLLNNVESIIPGIKVINKTHINVIRNKKKSDLSKLESKLLNK